MRNQPIKILEKIHIVDNTSDIPEVGIAETNISDKDNYINWLLKRINITEIELNDAHDLNLKISKGGKLCAYKECLNYIRKH